MDLLKYTVLRRLQQSIAHFLFKDVMVIHYPRTFCLPEEWVGPLFGFVRHVERIRAT